MRKMFPVGPHTDRGERGEVKSRFVLDLQDNMACEPCEHLLNYFAMQLFT